jgi:hypothetical protein
VLSSLFESLLWTGSFVVNKRPHLDRARDGSLLARPQLAREYIQSVGKIRKDTECAAEQALDKITGKATVESDSCWRQIVAAAAAAVVAADQLVNSV